MEGVANLFENKTKGVASISTFTLNEEEVKQRNIFSCMRREPYFMWLTSGEFVRLSVNGTLYMSDTNMERVTNEDFVANAHGSVMIAGLGVGLILNALRPKIESGEVTSIVVYEKYQDVIDLVLPKYSDLPLEVRCADILEHKPAHGEVYDTIYFDIWPSITSDNLDEMATLHRRWCRHLCSGGYMNSWMRDYLKKERSRERRRSSRFW